MASPESKVGENALPRMVVVGVLQGYVDTGGVKNWGHYCSQSNTLTSIIAWICPHVFNQLCKAAQLD